MNPIERYEKYVDDDIDRIVLLIKNGTIKSGKYARLVQVDKNFKLRKEVLPRGRRS